MWLLPSSRCSPGSVGSTSELKSPSPDQEWWVMLKETPTLCPPSWRGWKNRPWIRHLFGAVTSETWARAISHLGGKYRWSPEDSHVKTSRLLGHKPGSGLVRGQVCGQRCSESPTSSPPNGCSLKTSVPFARLKGSTWRTGQMTLFGNEHSEQYSEIWPRQGGMRSGCVYERETLARSLTKEIDGSVWPTAAASDYKGSVEVGQRRGQLDEAAEHWPTPTVGDGKSSGWGKTSDRVNRTRHIGTTLNDAIRAWDVPTIGPWRENQYPTPSGTIYGSSQNEGKVEHKRPSKGTPSLISWAHSHPDRQTMSSGSKSSPTDRGSRRRLNPAFVSWLMGFTWWWTRAEPINSGARAMDVYLSRQRLLLRSFFGG